MRNTSHVAEHSGLVLGLYLSLREATRTYVERRKLEPDALEYFALKCSAGKRGRVVPAKLRGIDEVGVILSECSTIVGIMPNSYPEMLPLRGLVVRVINRILKLKKTGSLTKQIKDPSERDFLMFFLDVVRRFEGWGGRRKRSLNDAELALAKLKFDHDVDVFGKAFFRDYVRRLQHER